MNIKQLEKEIIKAIKIESEIPLQSEQSYKDLIKFIEIITTEIKNSFSNKLQPTLPFSGPPININISPSGNVPNSRCLRCVSDNITTVDKGM